MPCARRRPPLGDEDTYRDAVRLARLGWCALAVGTAQAGLDYHRQQNGMARALVDAGYLAEPARRIISPRRLRPALS